MDHLLILRSALRIALSYGAGFGFVLMARLAIKVMRPDILAVDDRPVFTPAYQLLDEYDFIVVGSGSAGAVVASRLSENPAWTVLLLEAGPDENILTEVPLFMAAVQLSEIDWQFKTEPSSMLFIYLFFFFPRNFRIIYDYFFYFRYFVSSHERPKM